MKRLILSALVLSGAYFFVGCDSSSNSQKPKVEPSLNENIKNALKGVVG